MLWGKEAGTVIAGQWEDPQGSQGGRQEQRSQHCCFSTTHLQQVGEISAAVDVISQGPGCGGQEGFFIQKEMSIWTWVGLHRSRNQFALSHLPPFALPQKK